MLHRVDINKIPSRNVRIMLQFNRRLRQLKDTVAIVLLIHLYAEYWLNRLLEKSGLCTKRVSDMKFSLKLEKVRELKLLVDQTLLTNLSLLNSIRNKCAHTWEYDFLAEYRSGGAASEFVDDAGQCAREKLLQLKADDLQVLLKINQLTAVRLSQYCQAVHKIMD